MDFITKQCGWTQNEMYLDYAYYDLWAVRRVGDKDFNSPALFHLVKKEDAEKLLELLEKAR